MPVVTRSAFKARQVGAVEQGQEVEDSSASTAPFAPTKKAPRQRPKKEATPPPPEPFRLGDLPTEIILQVIENGPLLLSTSYEPPQLLLALAADPELYKVVSQTLARSSLPMPTIV